MIRRWFICFILFLCFILLSVKNVYADTCTGTFQRDGSTVQCIKGGDDKYFCQSNLMGLAGQCIFNSSKTQCGLDPVGEVFCNSCDISADGQSCDETGCIDSFISGYGCTFCNTVDGVCGAADGESYCSMPSSGLCSKGKLKEIDDVGNDGYFNWRCGTCTDSDYAYCKAKKLTETPKEDGVCSAAINGKVVQTKPLSTDLCSTGTPSNYTGTVNYTWKCNGTDGVCPASTATDPSCSATLDTKPALLSVVLKNTGGTVVNPDASGRNHTCETAFGGSRTSVWSIGATDAQGIADIKTIDIRFTFGANTYDFDAVTNPAGGIATFTVDTTDWPTGTYDVLYYLEDQDDPPGNTGWLDSGRDFKVWDCQVDVSGTFYDNSANLSCSNSNENGFTQTVGTDLSFQLDYKNATETKNMTVISPNFSSGANDLTWQNTYHPVIDENFPGVLKYAKIGSNCLSSWNGDFSLSNYVDAYTDDPTAIIKYGSIMDQDAWYRVINGGIFSRTNVTNYVPVTCVGVNDCKTAANGLIWSPVIDLSDSDTGTTSTAVIKRPVSYYYETLKYDIYGGKEVGTTIITGDGTVSWSEIIDDASTDNDKGVIFVDGDLTIDVNLNTSDSTDPILVVVKGKIIITEDVTEITGMLFSDNAIEASGESASQLKIIGSLYGKKGVTLDRSFTIKRDNNEDPAVEITYDPNLMFNLDSKLWYIYDNWTLE